jgi:UDP-N-acetylmuramate dehydrogenase
MAELREELDSFLGNDYRGEILFDEMLSRHTYLGIGGPADIYVIPADAISLKKCILFAAGKKLPVVVLGGGTNVLAADQGFRGMVASMKYFNMRKMVNEWQGLAELFVEAGVFLQGLVNFCVEKGYGGIEGLTGIPGTVGGAIMGNTGAHGQEIKDVVHSLVVMNYAGMIKKIERSQISFGYRKSNLPAQSIVLSANMRFKKDNPEALEKKMRQFVMRKKSTQPLSERSAGCVFKNPEGDSAGRLIDSAGCKGMRVGDIEVSEVHANFLINRGEGKASEFLALMKTVRERVAERTGVVLEQEIRIIGNEE